LKKLQSLVFAIVFILCCYPLYGQELQIDSALPEVGHSKMIRYKSPFFSFSGMNGKPMLLCFWNTTCTVGISFLRTLDSVQRKYGDKLQVVVVTQEKEAAVQKAYNDKALIRQVNLPVAIEDTILRRYFPHRVEPHLVWINESNRVEAITGHSELTEASLNRFIRKEPLNLPVKRETKDADVYYSNKPLIEGGDVNGNKHLLFYSFLGGYRDGVQAKSLMPYLNRQSGLVTLKAINTTMVRLFQMAHVGLQPYHPSRVIWEGTFSKEEKAVLYCYELFTKDSLRQRIMSLMQRNLDESFGIKSSLEKRTIKVLVLKRTTREEKFKTKSGSSRDIYATDGIQYVRNASWNGLTDIVFNTINKLPYYVVDETRITGKVDLDIRLKDIASMRSSLRKYGLDLFEEERVIEVLVLRKEK